MKFVTIIFLILIINQVTVLLLSNSKVTAYSNFIKIYPNVFELFLNFVEFRENLVAKECVY